MKLTNCPKCNSSYIIINGNVSGSSKGRTPANQRLPLVLSCGHTFCEGCLTERTKKVSGSEEYTAQVSCPTCNNITNLETAIKDLPVNMYISQAIGLKQQSMLELYLDAGTHFTVPKVGNQAQVDLDLPNQDQKCKMCLIHPAACRCVDCDSVLCNACFEKVHSISAAIRQHKPLPLGIPETSSKIEAECAEHKKNFEYFCEDDLVPICSRCFIVGSHKHHNIISLEEKNKDLLLDIEQEMAVATYVVENLKKVDKKCTAAIPGIKSDARRVTDNIRSSFSYVHSLLQAREMELVRSVTSSVKNRLQFLEEQGQSLLRSERELEEAVSSAKNLMENSSLVLNGKSILKTLKGARDIPCLMYRKKSSEVECVQWNETQREVLISGIQNFGTLTGQFEQTVCFKSVQEAPDELADLERMSLSSGGRRSPAFSMLATSEIASSIDSGEDVVIESNGTTDTESEVASRHGHPACANIFMPTVKGQPSEVLVTHITSPSHFYVQLTSNSKKLSTLSHNINTWCRRQKSAYHIPMVINKGMMVLARYSVDKQWYRAKVVGVEECMEGKGDNGLKVHVNFVDYGNSEHVAVKEMRTMQPRFMAYPSFAVQCSLTDIAPYDEDKPWSAEVVHEFHKLVKDQVLLLSAFSSHAGCLEVDLVFKPTEDALDDSYVSVRDILIFLELARFRTHSDTAKTTGTVPAYKKVQYLKPSTMKNGSSREVKVTHVISPSSFYVNCHGDERDYYIHMLSEMKELYESDRSNLYTLYCPQSGTVCSVRLDDGLWYRGLVIAPPSCRQVRVLLVDIGSIVTVHSDRLKKLHRQFIKLPKQAVHCRLADICPVIGPLGEWSEEALRWFMEALGTQGSIQVVRWGEPVEITLWLRTATSQRTTCNIGNKLRELGHAEFENLPPMADLTRRPITISGATGGMCDRGQDLHQQQRRGNSQSPARSVRSQDSSTGSSSSTMTSPQKGSPKPKKSAKENPSPEVSDQCSKKTKASEKQQSFPSYSKAEQRVDDKQKLQDDIFRALCNASDNEVDDPERITPYIEVILCSYKSPIDFDVRVKEKEEELKKLMEDLNVHYTAADKVPGSRQWKVGDYCAARTAASDGTWFRVEIKKIPEAGEIYEVDLVDYGISDQVTKADIRPLKTEFGTKLECASVTCHLANLIPAGSKDMTWSRTGIDFMLRHLKDSRRYFIKQVGEVVDNSLPVDMIVEDYIPETAFEPPKVSYHSVRQAIIKHGLAMPRKQLPCPLSPQAVGAFKKFIFKDGISGVDHFYIQFLKAEFEMPNMIIPLKGTSKYAQQKQILQCFTSELQSDFKLKTSGSNPEQPENGDLQEVAEVCSQSQTKSVTLDKRDGGIPAASPIQQKNPRKVPCLNLPPYLPPQTGDTVAVVPTWVDTEGIIYCQPCQWLQKITHLSQNLQSVYGNAITTAYDPCDPPIVWETGQLCIAYFPDDHLWYRASILQIKGDDAEVHYIDFGNSCWVKLSSLREMYLEFASIHMLAYSCILDNLEPNSDIKTWQTAVLNHISELVVNIECNIIVKELDEGSPVKIELFRKAGQLNINEYLVTKGLAVNSNDLSDMYRLSSAINKVWTSQNPYTELDIGGIGDSFKAFLVHIELPYLVYLQLAKLADPSGTDFVAAAEVAWVNSNIEEFIQMAETLKNSESMPFSHLPEPGTVCAAKFSQDDEWYRALCVGSYPNSDTCLVVFVDYGTCEVIHLSRMRKLNPQFWSFPQQAIRCYLNIVPPSGKGGLWTKKSLAAVHEALHGKDLIVKILQKQPLVVDLFVEEDGHMRRAYQNVIDAGLALLPEDVERQTSETIQDEPDVEIESEISNSWDRCGDATAASSHIQEGTLHSKGDQGLLISTEVNSAETDKTEVDGDDVCADTDKTEVDCDDVCADTDKTEVDGDDDSSSYETTSETSSDSDEVTAGGPQSTGSEISILSETMQRLQIPAADLTHHVDEVFKVRQARELEIAECGTGDSDRGGSSSDDETTISSFSSELVESYCVVCSESHPRKLDGPLMQGLAKDGFWSDDFEVIGETVAQGYGQKDGAIEIQKEEFWDPDTII